jgi:replicative DNA helicase
MAKVEAKISKKKIPQNLMPGKIPPQAIDFEMAVLGAILLERDALPKVIDILKPEFFYKDAHTIIYEAVLSLFRDSQPVDLLTVSQFIKQQGKLEIIGGNAYLAELTTRVSSAANIEYHARIVAQKYILRELIRISGEIMTEAYDETTDVFQLLDKAEQSLFSLSETNLRRNFETMSSLTHKTIQRLEELKTKGTAVTGIPSGFKALDSMTAGWQKSDLIIIAARPSMGKTAFTLNIARNAALLNHSPVAIFTLEMSAIQLAQRLLFAEAEINLSKGRTGNLSVQEWNQLNAHIGEISKAPIYIDDTPALSIMECRAKSRRLKAEKGIQLIIIDYLQLMRGDNRSGNREQEIAMISRSLKELAKELDIPIIALSQLSRAVETRGSDKKPMLSDLRESGSIEQDADMVMFLYRPEYYGFQTLEDGTPTEGICQVIIGKQRHGPVGEISLFFDKNYGKFRDFQTSFTPQFHQSTNPYTSSTPSFNPLDNTLNLPSKMNSLSLDDLDEFGDTPF